MFEFDEFDGGRLIVNRQFRELFVAHGLTTFAALYAWRDGEVVRKVKSRSTARVELTSAKLPGQTLTFYIKKHGRPKLKEYLKPLLNFGRPILGARNEWEAILEFHAAGIPTMIPIAFGESGDQSLVMTEGLGTDYTLLDWASSRWADAAQVGLTNEQREGCQRELISRVAQIASRMHARGAHHQDFYLNHMLWCGDRSRYDLRIIDLGRVRFHKKLSRRWIIKDLAQLDYSASGLSCADRLRFLRLYLGRPFTKADRRLVRAILCKSRRIATHTAKHHL